MTSPALVEILETISTHENELSRLHDQAAVIQARERTDLLQKIREVIAANHITSADCGFEDDRQPVKKAKIVSTNAKQIRYRNELGQTWSGGKGRQPSWLVQALASGKSLKQYSVFNATLNTAGQHFIYA